MRYLVTLSVVLTFAFTLALPAGDAPKSPAASKPSSQPASAPVYTVWPFDANEAARRQDETEKVLGCPKELNLNLGKGVSLKVVLVPAGRFMMGSPKEEQGREEEEAQHEVTISRPFYVGIFTVTQEQYEQVMGRNPSSFKGRLNPVEAVSWHDAAKFCKALSQKTGETVRLPTEAEWEWACRAGTATPFNTGDTLRTNQANYRDPEDRDDSDIGAKTIPVGTFKPNAFGLYDMHGNVGQWCADRYKEDYYAKSPKADPPGPNTGNDRAERGGGWTISRSGCRSAYRNACPPECCSEVVGFRVAVEIGKR
jgi:formylglycine-generating enzyme required for sulfatase activity